MIEMDQVPKVLKPMVKQWAPEGFIVSFKVRRGSPTRPAHKLTFFFLFVSTVQLETDGNLLVPKARAALERYGHQIVIGNDLNRRKYEVVFVERQEVPGSFSETWLRLESEESNQGDKEIEEVIVRELQSRHDKWISQGKDKV